MRVSSCPICGRQPKIKYCVPRKDGTSRRMCECPSYDSVVPGSDYLNHPWFIFIGDGDDNAIFSQWNKAIERYRQNIKKDWFDRDFSPWTDSLQVEFY